MLIEYLRKIPLFQHVMENQMEEIAARCKRSSFKKGKVIFYKTDPSTDLYIVIAGRLKAVLEDEQGGEMVLAYFDEGDFFGELGLIDGKGRSATIVADKDSELAVLRKDGFLELMYKDPKIAVELMITLVDRLRKADDMIESLAFLEVGERLVRTLLEVAQDDEGGDLRFQKVKKLTHKELAARIGSSREAVSKCMKVLANKGIIKEVEGSTSVARNAIELLQESGRK